MSIALLALPVPIIGTIVRYRASYTPKVRIGAWSPGTVVSLETAKHPLNDSEGEFIGQPLVEEKSHSGNNGTPGDLGSESVPIPQEMSEPDPTFTSIFKVVWAAEQFEGLFKGILPGVPFILFFSRVYISPAPITYNMKAWNVLIVNFLYLLVLVSTYRVIVSPHKIGLARPKEAYHLIFTEYERKKAEGFLRYSGVVLPFLIGIALEWFIFDPIRAKLGTIGPLLDHFGDEEWWKVFHHPVTEAWVKVALYLLLAVVGTIIMTPLDVIVTRLAIQPVHSKPGDVAPDDRDIEKMQEQPVLPVTSLRRVCFPMLTTGEKPYLGFVDCFRRIVEEEGWGVLYRAWWLTFLGNWFSVLR
ncbi:hypothetical protein B0H34DRAFT_678472 [Crassisporium funariophilum]|nr:hypothetical protein B0H34DRAFT_678472 [Crassisporium funariophilum]